MKPVLTPRSTPAASVSPTSGGGHLLTIPAGPAKNYRLAQLQNYWQALRSRFPSRPPQRLSLRARVVGGNGIGTWGFGFWNDPFGPTFRPFRLPALPNAAWFFFAAPENYLSLRDDKPARGLLAQTFRSPSFHGLLIPAALSMPFDRRRTRNLLSQVISEDAAAVDVDPAEWHRYQLVWESTRVHFEVDDSLILETAVSPCSPLGLIIWIDNQYAAFTPEGRLSWGVLAAEHSASLEIQDLDLS